ncbi:MAG: peroxiredoxin [Solirubrobacteraceae bacterium]
MSVVKGRLGHEEIVPVTPDDSRRAAPVILVSTRNQAEARSEQMAKTPKVGEQAPDFELQGTGGPFKLSEHLGERVVLLFYPGDNTMVCTKQFCSYRDRADDFAALDATVVGISSQDMDSHKGFIEKNGLTVPLLADVDKAVAKSYSAFSSVAGVKRAVIVIDEQGVVRHRHDHLLGLDYQSVDDLKAALEELPART